MAQRPGEGNKRGTRGVHTIPTIYKVRVPRSCLPSVGPVRKNTSRSARGILPSLVRKARQACGGKGRGRGRAMGEATMFRGPVCRINTNTSQKSRRGGRWSTTLSPGFLVVRASCLLSRGTSARPLLPNRFCCWAWLACLAHAFTKCSVQDALRTSSHVFMSSHSLGYLVLRQKETEKRKRRGLVP